MADRVTVTPQAAQVLRRLREAHGPVMFHQSGGCCDGSAPMCFPREEFLVGDRDVLLGRLLPQSDDETPVWISGPQFEYWSHTQVTIDVVPGRGSGFSLEAPEGVRFIVRSRLFTDGETAELDAAGPPLRGAQLAG